MLMLKMHGRRHTLLLLKVFVFQEGFLYTLCFHEIILDIMSEVFKQNTGGSIRNTLVSGSCKF